MSLAELAGRTFERTDPVLVTTQSVADFAAAVGAPYDSGAAPVTFPIVVTFAAIRRLVEDPTAGLTLAGLVHGEQRFSYQRPVQPGDELSAELTVESVRSMGEATWLRTRSDVHDQRGDLVLTAWSTLLHRPPDPVLPSPRSDRP